jgi:hypothetical protein
MRTLSKLKFIRSSLLLAALLPNLASAEVSPEEAAKKSRTLTLADAKKAFGPEFSADGADGIFTLYGVTTENCKKDNFDITNDSKKGEFKIFYKGFNDDCLDFEKSKAAIAAGEKSLGLSSLTDSKLTGASSFAALKLCSEDLASDKNRVRCQELTNEKDEVLAFESAADLEKKKKAQAEEKRQGQIEIDLQLVTKCNRGLSELDVGAEALARLAKIPSVVEEKGEKYFSAAEEKHRAAEFAACRLTILRTASSDISQTGCEERLAKISAADEKYASKVKALYLELVNRYMNSSTLGIEDAYEKSMEAIARARGLDLSEKEIANLDVSERNLHLNFLRLAAMKGENSVEFEFMKEKAADFIASSDTEGCLTVNETGMFLPAQRNPQCIGTQQLSAQFNNNLVIAHTTQGRMNVAAQIAQQKENDALKLGECRTAELTKTPQSPAETNLCSTLKAKADLEEKMVLNAGLDGKGFGTIADDKDAKTTATVTQSDELSNASGLLNTGYGDKAKSDTKTEVTTDAKLATPTSPTPPAVTANVPAARPDMSTMRRVFR